MVLYLVDVIRQKVPLPPKVLVFPGVSKYFLSGLAILPGLLLKPLRLGAELNFAPIPSGFNSNPTTIANSDSKYLENSLWKSVFWP
jgi:hypothetical protein